MLASSGDLAAVLAAPGGTGLVITDDAIRSIDGREYMRLNGKPVLIDFDESVIDRDHLVATAGRSVVARRKGKSPLRQIVTSMGTSEETTRRNIRKLLDELPKNGLKKRVLVVGGGSIGLGTEDLYDDPDTSVVAFDIYDSANTQLVADAHKLPFRTGVFDAVLVQAVLEHVLDPATCVAEIARVLVPDGCVYAETPFMQQVHEGPFDFTRFTESGHRYLFRKFSAVSVGAVGGPAAAFLWSVDYLLRSVTRSRAIGKAAKLALSWLVLLDRIIDPKHAVDAASGVYFLGRKTDKEITVQEAIRHYQGAQ